MSATTWTEARANVANAGLPAWILRLVSFAAAAALTWSTVAAADDAIDAQRQLDAEGRQLLLISAQSGTDLVDARYCDRLSALPGVAASGGTLVDGMVPLATGQAVPLVRLTPGVDRVVAPVAAGRAPVMLGGTLADDLGIPAPAGVVGVVGARGVVETVTAFALPVTARTGSFDDSLLVVDAALGLVDTCYVDPVPSARDALVVAIGALAPPDRPVVVLPFRDDLERDRSPERELAAAAGGPLTAVVALVLALAPAGWWYARRQELALYRTFGLAAGSLRRLLTYEWFRTVGLAAVAGTAWATWATASRDPTRVAIETGLLNAAAAAVASATVVGLTVGAANRLGIVRSLKGG